MGNEKFVLNCVWLGGDEKGGGMRGIVLTIKEEIHPWRCSQTLEGSLFKRSR